MQRLDADSELRLSLWSLEALYKLSNTLATSVKTVEEAIEDMTREINQVSRFPAPRSSKSANIVKKGPWETKLRARKHLPQTHGNPRAQFLRSDGCADRAATQGRAQHAVHKCGKRAP